MFVNNNQKFSSLPPFDYDLYDNTCTYCDKSSMAILACKVNIFF